MYRSPIVPVPLVLQTLLLLGAALWFLQALLLLRAALFVEIGRF